MKFSILGLLLCITMLANAEVTDQNQSASTKSVSSKSVSGKMVLTKFQQRAIKIKKMNDAAEAEERKLEEDGFCPCSVQKP